MGGIVYIEDIAECTEGKMTVRGHTLNDVALDLRDETFQGTIEFMNCTFLGVSLILTTPSPDIRILRGTWMDCHVRSHASVTVTDTKFTDGAVGARTVNVVSSYITTSALNNNIGTVKGANKIYVSSGSTVVGSVINLYDGKDFAADDDGVFLSGVDFLCGANHDALLDCKAVAVSIPCPREGSFVAYKKVYADDGAPLIAKLRIPASAKRSSSGGRKCRASAAKVLSITSIDGKEKHTSGCAWYRESFRYYTGEVAVPNRPFDENWTKDCTNGIHFFMTREEAVNFMR